MSKLRGRFSCVGQLAKSATNGRLWITKGLNWNIFYHLAHPAGNGRRAVGDRNADKVLVAERGDNEVEQSFDWLKRRPNKSAVISGFYQIFSGFFSAEINDWKRLNVFVHSHGRIDNAVAS